MSHSGSESNRRRPSEDNWTGKRTAEDDETSSLSEPQKRARREDSSPTNEDQQQQTQDFIVVSSQRVPRKTDDQRDTDARATNSSQPSSCLSSPLSSAPSRLTEDCGEMAQKAMEAWQNTLVPTNSESNRQDLPTGPQNSVNEVRIDEVRTSLPPRSPRFPPGPSLQSRDWLGASSTSTEKQFRTPLPTQKELRHLDASPRSNNSPNGGDDARRPDSHNIAQPTSASPMLSDVRQVGGNRDQPIEHLGDYPRPGPNESIQLSVRDPSMWRAGNENRSLPPLPSMSAQFPNLPRPLDHQSPGLAHNGKGLEGRLNSFSSNFSVLTTEEVQRNQVSSNRGGRRRGRKPSGLTGDRPHLASNGADSQSDSFMSQHDGKLENGQEGPSPQFRDTILQPGTGRRPVTTTSTAPQIYHTIHPRKSSTPPPTTNDQQGSFQPPPVVFTIDNRAESTLQTSEIQPFVTSFTQNTTVLLAVDKDIIPHGITVIMWQSLGDFYKWYAQSARVQDIGPLMFELIDVHWQEEKSFVVPEGSLNYFRTIKQYIWDLYWLAVDINKGPREFRVLITPFSPRGESSPPKPWKPVNSRILGSPRIHETEHNGPVILESTPGPLYQRRLSGQSPSLPSSAARTRPATHRQVDNHRRNSFEPNQASHEAGNQRPHSLPSSSPHMRSTRTPRDQAMLRERANAYLADRRDFELLGQESTVLDKLPYKTGAEVTGVVIDKRSGKGMVAITGKGYITLNVKTGPDEIGDRYQDIAIQPKQTCMLHGEAVVLFYKRRSSPPEPTPPTPSIQPENNTIQRPSTAPDVDIVIRLQIDGTGKYSAAFDKSVLRPNRITTTEFFSWFATQSGHCPPQGPPYLKFTFKDAMPTPTSTEIVRGNEDHFNYMRKDIKMQCEKAKKYMVDLKEFVILVTVPGWTNLGPDEEEEW